jgi:hypothetical protein
MHEFYIYSYLVDKLGMVDIEAFNVDSELSCGIQKRPKQCEGLGTNPLRRYAIIQWLLLH